MKTTTYTSPRQIPAEASRGPYTVPSDETDNPMVIAITNGEGISLPLLSPP